MEEGLRLSRCSKSPSLLSGSRFASWGPSENIILMFLFRKDIGGEKAVSILQHSENQADYILLLLLLLCSHTFHNIKRKYKCIKKNTMILFTVQ